MPRTFLRARRRLSKTKGRNRKPRPKTFASKEKAETWAKQQGIKDYKLKDLRPFSKEKHKIQVIENKKE
ncbi:MAG: hypothetical protein ACQESC_03105 [Nanobdellota archaeon]